MTGEVIGFRPKRRRIRIDVSASPGVVDVAAPTVEDLERAAPPRDPIGVCQHCQSPIEHGQPYMGRIPFVGSWGGFVHRHCRPVLQVLNGGASDG